VKPRYRQRSGAGQPDDPGADYDAIDMLHIYGSLVD